MTNLTGKALKARAAELQIPGRSSMSAAELRQAIIEADNAKITKDFGSTEGNTKLVEAITKEYEAPAVRERNALLLRQASANVVGSAAPMTAERRMEVYLAKGKVTPKMARRARQKENRSRG